MLIWWNSSGAWSLAFTWGRTSSGPPSAVASSYRPIWRPRRR